MSEMPVTGRQHYTRWTGRMRPGRWTWLSITMQGLRQGFKPWMTRALVSSAILLVASLCSIFYLLSFLEEQIESPQGQGWFEVVRGFLGINLREFVGDLSDYRTVFWRTAFMVLFKLQALWVLLIVARVGPGLISNDVKARALPIYFSKPVTPLTYLLGKWLIVASFIGVVSLLPNLLGLIAGTLITGGLATWGETFSLGADLLVAGLGVMLLGGSIMMALSSLSSDRRFVAVGWLAVCLLPFIAQSILRENLPREATTGWLGSVSLLDNVAILAEWLFDLRARWEATGLDSAVYRRVFGQRVAPFYPAVVLAGVTLVSIAVCYRRVVRFSRSAANL